MKGVGGSRGFELSARREVCVYGLGDVRGGFVIYRPEGADHMPVAGVMQCRCQGDGLVRKADSAGRGHARRQESELTTVVPSADVGCAEKSIVQQQPSSGGVREILAAMAAEMCPPVT